jgi:acetoin utilization deacetylase AcuC-like enzyme
MPSRPLILRAAWGLTAILLVNSAVITIVHFRWEIEAARTARAQLAELRQMETLDVDFQAFRVAYAERLRAAGVQFREVSHLSPTNSMELFSVAPGYHHAVRARVH